MTLTSPDPPLKKSFSFWFNLKFLHDCIQVIHSRLGYCVSDDVFFSACHLWRMLIMITQLRGCLFLCCIIIFFPMQLKSSLWRDYSNTLFFILLDLIYMMMLSWFSVCVLLAKYSFSQFSPFIYLFYLFGFIFLLSVWTHEFLPNGS